MTSLKWGTGVTLNWGEFPVSCPLILPPKDGCAELCNSFTVIMDLSHRVYVVIFHHLNAILSRFPTMFSKSKTPKWNAESSTNCYTAWSKITSLLLSTGGFFPL